MENVELEEFQDVGELQRSSLLDIQALFKEEQDIENIANKILEGTYLDIDILRKDTLDRFLDFVIFMVKTGNTYVINQAYPTKRMADLELEEKIIQLINIHLYPDIILRILKYFTRNIYDSDTNLYLANLIQSDELINAILDTFQLFKKDILINDRDSRTLNVKRIQQFSLRADNIVSSPLDAACRLKYILEFIALKQNVNHLFTNDDITLS
ncbi:MAG: hypothetical protein SVR08_03825 [Spirochaetota bacterium]|nr:hypothetical protein [Spirochaetota bacterium]